MDQGRHRDALVWLDGAGNDLELTNEKAGNVAAAKLTGTVCDMDRDLVVVLSMGEEVHRPVAVMETNKEVRGNLGN